MDEQRTNRRGPLAALLLPGANSFRLTSVPERRTLLRITLATWIVGLLSAANWLLVARGAPHNDVVLKRLLSACLGNGTMSSLGPFFSLFGTLTAIAIPLSLFIGVPIGLFTLIVACCGLKTSEPDGVEPAPFEEG